MKYRTERAEGYVWCLTHGSIHDDTTDPFDCEDDRCEKSEHRLVLARLRPSDGPL